MAVGSKYSAAVEKTGYYGYSAMKENKWVRLLAYVTGLVNQELLLQNEYLATENRILRAHWRPRFERCGSIHKQRS